MSARAIALVARSSICSCVLAFLAACRPPTDIIPPGDNLLLVESVLDAGAPRQYVSVQRTSGFGTTREILDAVVTITDPHGVAYSSDKADSVTGAGNSRRLYVVPLQGLFLEPGGIYTLRVALQTGEVATGTTTIPEASRVTGSDTIAVFERARDTLRLAWPKAAAARSYQLLVQMRYRFVGADTAIVYAAETFRAFLDTSVTLPGLTRSIDDVAVFWEPQPNRRTAAEIAAVAVDDNYYTYYHTTTDPFAGAPPTRLTGAIGVFGAVVPVARKRINEIR